MLYPYTSGCVPIHNTTDGKLNAAEACCNEESIRSLLLEAAIKENNSILDIELEITSAPII